MIGQLYQAYNLRMTSAFEPLASRLRPKEIDDIIGQEHLTGPAKPIRRYIESEHLPSLIFWGPPGVGKTTLAHVISQTLNKNFVELSAVNSGVKDVKAVIEQAKYIQQMEGKQTVLFLDEIHRFNKAQQDAFLPSVESGIITLIGATTENPSFEINSALLSRCQVLTLKPLNETSLIQVIDRALSLKNKTRLLSDSAKKELALQSFGDARYLLNALEDLLQQFYDRVELDDHTVKEHIHSRSLHYDKKSEHHYNVISAFIKSMRGSDVNAALYYLARMLESGEDPLFVARRMIIFASEDIGLANPQAVQVAVSCMQSFQFVGAAEGWIPLAQCAAYLAGSPKSNSSYAAYKLAADDVRKHGALEVPLHLRNAPTKLMKQEGYGQGYKYAHNYSGNKVQQQHLPDKIKDKIYYEPTENGHEKKIKEWLSKI